MSEMPLEKLIATICDTGDLTDAEVREELAEQGIDLDAAMAWFRPKLDDLMRAREVRLALAAVKANPAHPQNTLPWDDCNGEVRASDGVAVCDASFRDAAHIAAAVNAAPVLAAEVERLTALLAAARVAVEALPEYYHEASCGIECGHGDCCCPAEYGETKRTAARRAVGLEESHG
jgi:hypothetical protein